MNENNNISGVTPNPAPMPMGPENAVNPSLQPAAPTYVNPQPMENVAMPAGPMTEQTVLQPDPMAAVANLNKEEAMEEALSHTTQYSPFEAPKQEVNQEVKKDANNKSAYIFIGIIFLIMLLFIIFLPQISKLFGW